MTQENKKLLLKDLSARLPYKVIVDYAYNAFDVHNRTFYDWQRELEFKNTKHVSILKLFKKIFVNFLELCFTPSHKKHNKI